MAIIQGRMLHYLKILTLTNSVINQTFVWGNIGMKSYFLTLEEKKDQKIADEIRLKNFERQRLFEEQQFYKQSIREWKPRDAAEAAVGPGPWFYGDNDKIRISEYLEEYHDASSLIRELKIKSR